MGNPSRRLQDGKKGEPATCSLLSLQFWREAVFLHPQPDSGELPPPQPQMSPVSSDTPTSTFLPLRAPREATKVFLMLLVPC